MKAILLTSIILLLAACTSESYESGEGKYSGMRADFTEAVTDGTGAIKSFTTDDGDQLTLTRAVKPQWQTKADTTYRALIYYNKVAAEASSFKAEPLSVVRVLVPQPRKAAELKDGYKTDPVIMNSAWMSRSGRYLNLDLSIKTGKTDDDKARHTLGLVIESTKTDNNGHTTYTLTLTHDRGGVPEYYSAECYVSIPLYGDELHPVKGDTLVLNVNTYEKAKEVMSVIGNND